MGWYILQSMLSNKPYDITDRIDGLTTAYNESLESWKTAYAKLADAENPNPELMQQLLEVDDKFQCWAALTFPRINPVDLKLLSNYCSKEYSNLLDKVNLAEYNFIFTSAILRGDIKNEQ